MTPGVGVAASVVLFGAAAIWLLRARLRALGRERVDALVVRDGQPELPLPPSLRELIERAALPIGSSAIAALWVSGIAVVLAFSALNQSIGFALTGGTAAMVGPVLGLWLLRHRRDRQIETDLPTALETIGRSIRSGASFPQAIGETLHVVRGPLRHEFVRIDRDLTLGQPLVTVLRQWTERRDLPGVRLAAAALVFSYEAGGVRSRAIDGLAASLRDKIALEREVAALASQSRMSGVVVSLLPVGFVVLSSSLDAQISAFLFGSALGLTCLAAGLTLDAIGFVWMHRLTSAIR